MYSKTTKLYFSLWPYVAIAVVGQIAIEIIKEKLLPNFGLNFVSFVVWVFLAYSAHAAILLSRDRDLVQEGKKILGFVLLAAAISLLLSIIFLFMLYISDGQVSRNLTTMIIVNGIIFLLVTTLFGTILPAFVIRHDVGLVAAFSRGISQFWWLAGHLLIGPFLVGVIAKFLIVPGLNLTDFDSLAENTLPFLALILGYTLQAFCVVMVAWVLSTAYLRSEAR